jgi:hypothetical protein
MYAFRAAVPDVAARSQGCSAATSTIVPILRYRELNYSFLVSTTEDLIVQRALPVARNTVIGLSARVHAARISAGAKFEFIFYAANPSISDGRLFVYTATALAESFPLDSTVVAGDLRELQSAIVDAQAPYVQIVLRATGPSSTGNLYAVLSADVTLKTG